MILDTAGVPRAKELVIYSEAEGIAAAVTIGFPLVMKVVGPIHKSDLNGVSLNIKSNETVRNEFRRMMNIEGATGVLMAEMLSGTELFIGAKYEPAFGHIMLCGLGGIFVEALKDVTSGLAPLSMHEAQSMIKNIRARKILKGYRGNDPVSETEFAKILVKLSSFLRFATEIKEMDINPLLGKGDTIVAVDARVLIEHSTSSKLNKFVINQI